MDAELYARAAEVLEACRRAGVMIATVESCTGGLVAATLTEVAGSSDVVDRGFVTYTNEAKNELVGVPLALFPAVGAVSEEVARAMAAGGLAHSRADIAVGITGVAGPGQSENKPAGLVHIAAARRGGQTFHERCRFDGDRSAVRRASVLKAFEMIQSLARPVRKHSTALPDRVAGIDFSGARDAGKFIWIAEGTRTAAGVRIDRLTRADALPGGGIAKEEALPALVEHVAGLGDCIVGFDFPFSLPRTLIRQRSWTAFVRAFAAAHPDADSFRDAARAVTGGKELKRRTDTDAKAPWCAYNLKLYRQTWAGISQVLQPLVAANRARVVPMQKTVPGKPVIAEICPASLLKREELYKPYKGRGDALRKARARILNELARRRIVAPIRGRLRETILDNAGGDALDAVLAAAGAARVDNPLPRDATDRIEARIYF